MIDLIYSAPLSDHGSRSYAAVHADEPQAVRVRTSINIRGKPKQLVVEAGYGVCASKHLITTTRRFGTRSVP
jgi:hypothetical protein